MPEINQVINVEDSDVRSPDEVTIHRSPLVDVSDDAGRPSPPQSPSAAAPPHQPPPVQLDRIRRDIFADTQPASQTQPPHPHVQFPQGQIPYFPVNMSTGFSTFPPGMQYAPMFSQAPGSGWLHQPHVPQPSAPPQEPYFTPPQDYDPRAKPPGQPQPMRTPTTAMPPPDPSIFRSMDRGARYSARMGGSSLTHITHERALALTLSLLPGEYFFSSFYDYQKKNITSIQSLTNIMTQKDSVRASFQPMLDALKVRGWKAMDAIERAHAVIFQSEGKLVDPVVFAMGIFLMCTHENSHNNDLNLCTLVRYLLCQDNTQVETLSQALTLPESDVQLSPVPADITQTSLMPGLHRLDYTKNPHFVDEWMNLSIILTRVRAREKILIDTYRIALAEFMIPSGEAGSNHPMRQKSREKIEAYAARHEAKWAYVKRQATRQNPEIDPNSLLRYNDLSTNLANGAKPDILKTAKLIYSDRNERKRLGLPNTIEMATFPQMATLLTAAEVKQFELNSDNTIFDKAEKWGEEKPKKPPKEGKGDKKDRN